MHPSSRLPFWPLAPQTGTRNPVLSFAPNYLISVELLFSIGFHPSVINPGQGGNGSMRTVSRQNVTDCGEASTGTQAPGNGVGLSENAGSGGLVDRWGRENPRSAALAARARALLPGGVAHDVRMADPFPVAVAHAHGAHKQDLDGHDLLCYVMGHGALLLGHGHPAVVEAVREQAGRSFHPGACHELESDWAEAVIRLVPSAERVRFTSSGTEATLLALRLARAGTGRGKVIKLAGHFHGWHDQVAIGTDPPFDGPDTAGLPPGIVSSVVTVPADPAALAGALAEGDVAAVILEPSGAAWGTVPLPDGFLQAARRLADESGALLVFDEVV